jgi:hypothetical protein
MSAWITVTLREFSAENYRQVRVRRSAILSYGTKPYGHFIDLGGKEILVIESEAELAALIGDTDGASAICS